MVQKRQVKGLSLIHISVDPYKQGNRTACDYCPYHSVCGFDPVSYTHLSWIYLGKEKTIKTLKTVVIMTVILDGLVTPYFPVYSGDKMVSCLFGGVLILSLIHI